MVEVGQIIIVDGTEKYVVHEIWPAGASKVIDFVAKRTESKGVDWEGNQIYAGRGFSYAVKNWELEGKQMTNDEKLALLNTIKVIDSSSSAGELEYVCINSTTTNKVKLRMLGVADEEIDNYTDREDGTIDIVPFISNYVEYGWFEPRLGGFLKQKPENMFIKVLIERIYEVNCELEDLEIKSIDEIKDMEGLEMLDEYAGEITDELKAICIIPKIDGPEEAI